jgi:4-hydroxybenzoate polyprenyltransferase
LIYFVLNLAYTLKLKHYPLIDVFIIAIGFVLRVIIGGVVTEIELSHWIILMTFLLALFLAFAKRRDDVLIFEDTGICMRSGIQQYNTQFLDQTLTVLASIMIVCYIMYTVSEEVVKRLNCNYVYITSIFVVFGMLRYLQISIVKKNSGSPTKILLKDRFIQITVLLWVISFIFIIYLWK